MKLWFSRSRAAGLAPAPAANGAASGARIVTSAATARHPPIPLRPAPASADAPRPRKAFIRLKEAFFKREVDISGPVPGTGSVTERPVRARPPPASGATVDPLSPSAQAEALLDRLQTAQSTVWERPARPLPNRIATTALPWLKPRPLREKAVLSQAQQPLGDHATDVAPDLAQLRHRDKAAHAVREIARTQLRDAVLAAPDPSGTLQPARQRAVAALQAAESRAAQARSDLLAGASAASLQPQLAHVLALEQRAAESGFRHRRLADTRQALEGQRSAAMARARVEDAHAARADLAAMARGDDAVRQASRRMADEPDPAAEAARARAAFDRVEAQALSIQARLPPGFDDSVASRRFGTRLWASVRLGPRRPSPEALPDIAVMEVAARSISMITGGDARRATRLLRALRTRRPDDWMREGPDDEDLQPPPDVADDVRALWRLASALPRGIDVLYRLAAWDTPMPDASHAEAARTFWFADAAQRQEPLPEVRAWLDGAKRAACRRLPAPAGAAPPSDADEAVYNAVRNGCVSNAPGSAYDQHDRRLRKATADWLERAAPAASPATRTHRLARAFAPNHHKTPYRALALATEIAESLGMTTQRRLADDGTHAAAARLEQWAQDDLGETLVRAGLSGADARTFVAATRALAARVLAEPHPSVVTLGRRDDERLRADTHDRLRPRRSPDRPNVLHKPHRHFVLVPPFHDLMREPGTSLDKLRAVADYIKLTVVDVVDGAALAPLAHDPAVHAAARDARRPRFENRDDLVRYFEPILRHMQVRDRLKLTGGGTVGVGVPSVPIGGGVAPLFSAGYSRKDEAFIQAFMPLLGLELSVGGSHTTSLDAMVGAAAGPHVTGVAKLQASATQAATRAQAQTRGTVLRLQRKRGADDAMRGEMLGVLDSWIRWDQHRAGDGSPFAGPLQAVLARHPAISLGEIEAESTTRTFVTRAAVAAAVVLPAGHGESNRLGAAAGISFKAERLRDTRTERGGRIRIAGDAGDTAQQKIVVDAQLNALLPANGDRLAIGRGDKGVALAGGGVPGVLGITRDVFWNLERHGVSPFLVDGLQDADLDRHAARPADMLAEIRLKRDLWLARCLQTLPADATGATDTRQNRETAEALLQAFEARLEELGRTSRLCQYNVNYSMRPQASCWIDGFRALATLAAWRDDSATVRANAAASDRVMQQSTTWRPLMLIVREKAREAHTTGVNFVARLQTNVGVEGQRTAAQFPPL